MTDHCTFVSMERICRHRSSPRLTGLLLVGLAPALAGCGGGKSETAVPAIVIDGSSTVYRISQAAQEAYASAKPSVNVVVDNHGTGGGFGRYLQGEVDIVDASRDAEPEETSKSKAQGIEWTRFLVGYDGITVVTNPKNEIVKNLTVAQLKAIWMPNSPVKTWKDVNASWPRPQDLSL